MSTPTVNNLLTSTYGGNVTTDRLTLADRGFTARTMVAAEEGTSTTSVSTLLTGFTPQANASTQVITFANLNVDENSGTKFRLAIRPNTADGTQSLYRKRISSAAGLESLDYNEINSTGIDRSSYLFSGTKLGVDGLCLGGTVEAAQAGAYYASGGTGGAPTTYNSTSGITGGSPTLSSALTGSENYGSWPVMVDIQALLTTYEKFTLCAGSPVLADDVLQKLNGEFVKFSEMPTIGDTDGNFIADFLVTPTLYQIVKNFSTTKVKFAAGSYIPEGTVVRIGDYDADGAVADLSGANRFMEYNYAAYPIYTFDLSQGSSVEIAVDIAEGFVVPGGQVIPLGSNFTDVDGSVITDSLTLPDIKAQAGFQLHSGVELTGVILMDSYSKIVKGMTSSLYQPVVAGMHTECPLSMQGIQFVAGSALEANLTVDDAFDVEEAITITKGSLLKAGTRIPKGSQTLEGALIDSTITIAKGAVVTDRVEIRTPFVVEASTGSGDNPIMPGAILNGPFTFPVGTQITSGNILPSALKILMTMGNTLAAGMKLAAGSVFGSTAMLHGDVGFSPNGSIPTLSTLYGSFTLPMGTKLSAGFTSNFNTPVPHGTVFLIGTIIHALTTFKEGAILPEGMNLFDNAGPAYVSGPTSAGPLTKFTDPSEGSYYVIKAFTTLKPGFSISVGSIMSAVATAGHTGALGTGPIGASTTTSPYTTDYELAPGSYSLDEGSFVGGVYVPPAPAQDTFTFVPGVPTNTLVTMLTDTTLPTDLVIPCADADPNMSNYLSFNEMFVTNSDFVLTQPYVVHGSNNVTWPANIPIPSEFALSSAFTFTTPGSGSQISKAIHFNVPTTNEFINGVMTSSSSIKLPPAGFTLDAPIKLAVNQPVANTGSNAFKATVTLAIGTKLVLSGTQYVQLVIPMNVLTNFTVNAQLNVFPQFRLDNGIVLLPGQTTPGPIVVGINTPLPKNLTLDQEITLSADLETKEASYTLEEFAYLAPGTVLARGTVFPEGANFVSKTTMAPILSLSIANIFFFFEDNPITATIKVPYLYDSASGTVLTLRYDARGLIQRIADLENELSATNALLVNHLGH